MVYRLLNDINGTDTHASKDNVLKPKTDDNFSIKNACIRYAPKLYFERTIAILANLLYL